MDFKAFIKKIGEKYAIEPPEAFTYYDDEIYLFVKKEDFKKVCVALHKELRSPVMMQFAEDVRYSTFVKGSDGVPLSADTPVANGSDGVPLSAGETGMFFIYCVFMSAKYKKCFFVVTEVTAKEAVFNSLAKELHSATLFEREIKEMFGIEPKDCPDLRRLHLHNEVWPEGVYPLRKDFKAPLAGDEKTGEYIFNKVEGEGIFEVPVGPVHAGIIAPGHFRISCAGEPIVNLEIRLGFTHRGIEKLFEGKNIFEAIELSECIVGDSVAAHSSAFCQAVEKICGVSIPENALILRAIFLELERMYNHVNDIGGIAVDVGFSFAQGYASLIKEEILQLNDKITTSRYLKGVNAIGGVSLGLDEGKKKIILDSLKRIVKDFNELKKILFSSVSFMDRVDSTGILRKKTAQDFGVVGLSARASGIAMDLRKDFPGIYGKVKFNSAKQETGDVLARLNLRIFEFEESTGLIRQFIKKLESGRLRQDKINYKAGYALGYMEGWRGPVLYWVRINSAGLIERCKIVDPSFHNWPGLSYAVLGNIIPDFPLCNKSFDLSYAGNDL